MIAGVAGLVAGAMSRAAGEYVSVGAQSDTEQADLARERKELSELSLSDLNGRAPWIFSTRGPVLVRSNDVTFGDRVG